MQAAYMSDKQLLARWVLEALRELGGEGTVLDVSRWVWQHKESELRAGGDLFFTWQYDIRWAAQTLRDQGKLQKAQGRERRQPWRLETHATP